VLSKAWRLRGARLIAEHPHQIVVLLRSWDGEELAMGTWAAFVIGASSLLLLKMFVFQF
jgi:hypothetical protein